MQLGNIVKIKALPDIWGRVMSITDTDEAVIKVCGSQQLLQVLLGDLEVMEDRVEPYARSESKVHILGTEYTIKVSELPEGASGDGLCDFSTHTIYAYNYPQSEQSKADLVQYQNKVIRHEIVHAFLAESGLQDSTNPYQSGWAYNEEMVDWMAIQIPKIYEAFREANVIDNNITIFAKKAEVTVVAESKEEVK